jgi:outer membrane protein OmpU
MTMKKGLLATSAILAAGVLASTSAHAAEKIKLNVGGKVNEFFVMGSVDNSDDRVGVDLNTGALTANTTKQDQNNFGLYSDTEIYFSGSTKLDNGLTVSARVELEAQRVVVNNRNADQQYLTIASDTFGKVEAGQLYIANYKMHHGAPNATGFGIAEVMTVVGYPTETIGGNTYAAFAKFEGTDFDSLDSRTSARVNYYTPSYMGFQLGLSYAPSPEGWAMADEMAAAHDAWSATLAYNGNVAGVDVGADAGFFKNYDTNGNDSGSIMAHNFGLSLGYAGFELAGSYMKVREGNPGNTTVEGRSWDVGLGYSAGPWTATLAYYNEKNEGAVETIAAGSTVAINGVTTAIDNNGDNKVQLWQLGTAYQLSEGIDLIGSLAYVDAESEINYGGNDKDAWLVITGVQLSF